MIHRARSVRVVVLLNYSSLKADRGRGVRDLTNILTDLFGRADNLLNNAPSILLGVSQLPKTYDGDVVELRSVLWSRVMC